MSEPKVIKIDNTEYIRKEDAEKLYKSHPKIRETEQNHPYFVGEVYHVETATKYYVGTLVSVTDNELTLEDAAWVVDSGRVNEYFKGSTPKEMEPLYVPVHIGRGAIVAAMPYQKKIEIVVR